MNERIKELAEQATASISYRVCQNTFKEIEDPTGPFVRKEFSKEKFAELIIRECARIADRKYLYSKEPNRWDSGFNISCEILEQFGILKNE